MRYIGLIWSVCIAGLMDMTVSLTTENQTITDLEKFADRDGKFLFDALFGLESAVNYDDEEDETGGNDVKACNCRKCTYFTLKVLVFSYLK